MKNILAEYVNHSGGAVGSDYEWGNIGKEFGMVHNSHYWYGAKTPHGNTEITKEQLETGWQHVLLANETLNRQPDKYKNLLSRNWMQVYNAQAVFAIAKVASLTQVKGGTGWAVQMAIDDFRDVYVFDLYQNTWCKWDYSQNNFTHTRTPTLTVHFAGIGTREINEAGRRAIRDVYELTSIL